MKAYDLIITIWVLIMSISMIIFSGRVGESYRQYLDWWDKNFPGSVHPFSLNQCIWAARILGFIFFIGILTKIFHG